MRTSIAVPARLDELESLRTWLVKNLTESGVTNEVVEDLFLIAEEAFVNTVSYGYEGDADSHQYEVRLSCLEGLITLQFLDDARRFDPLAAPDVDVDLPDEERPIGGLGIHLVKALSDRVSYDREGGRNILTVERKV